MTIQCPITVTVTAPAPVTPTISAACEAWIASRGIDLNAVTSDDVFAAFSAVNSGVIDYACGQVIAAAYQSPPPPAPVITYSAGFAVFDSRTADFLAANISVAGLNLIGRADGKSVTANLPAGIYTVTVSYPGYSTKTVSVTVIGNAGFSFPLDHV